MAEPLNNTECRLNPAPVYEEFFNNDTISGDYFRIYLGNLSWIWVVQQGGTWSDSAGYWVGDAPVAWSQVVAGELPNSNGWSPSIIEISTGYNSSVTIAYPVANCTVPLGEYHLYCIIPNAILGPFAADQPLVGTFIYWLYRVNIVECGSCPGGTNPPPPPPPPQLLKSAIETDSARGLLIIGGGNTVSTYNVSDLSVNSVSNTWSGVDTFVNLKRDDRSGCLIALTRTASGSNWTFKIWQSDDCGMTGTVIVSLTGNSSLLVGTGARGQLAWFVGDTSDNVTVQHSSDGGATWGKLNADGSVTPGSSNQVKYNGSNLVAKLLDKTMDPRSNSSIFMIVNISGNFVGPIVSEDLGITFGDAP